jgi:hypothetical protein
LQKDLQDARKQLEEAAPGATSGRMHEMQGALRQAVKDYELLLQELGNVRNDSRKKSDMIEVLRARLSKAGEEQQSQQCALPLLSMRCLQSLGWPKGIGFFVSRGSSLTSLVGLHLEHMVGCLEGCRCENSLCPLHSVACMQMHTLQIAGRPLFGGTWGLASLLSS